MKFLLKSLPIICLSFQAFSHVPEESFINENWLNTKIHPAANFFEYANGEWLKTNQIPDDEAEWGIFDILDQEVKKQIKEMIENLPLDAKQSQYKVFQQVYDFYQSGLNLTLSEKTQLGSLKSYIQEINELDAHKDLGRMIAKLHGINVKVFFNLEPSNDLRHPTYYIAEINQDGLFLPNRNYYIQSDEKSIQIQKAYQRFVETLFFNLNYDYLQAHQAYLDTWAIEKKLASIAKNNDYFRVPENYDHPFPSKKLFKTYPRLDFKSYLHELKLGQLNTINVANPDYFLNLNQALTDFSNIQIQHYLLTHLLGNYAPYLNQAYRKPYFDFLKMLRGNPANPERWKQVLETESNLLGFAIGELYVKNYARPGQIEYIQRMIKNIKLVLKEKIATSKWLSKQTKKEALLKIKTMTSRIGYPEHSLNYEKLEVGKQSYVENVLAANRFETHRQWQRMNHLIDTTEWEMPPQSINAYYDVSLNQINIPLGILQKPFFDIHAPDAINYGGIGVVIGHEMFHGFDDEGAQFDAQGKFNYWWTPDEWLIYQAKIQCIIQQFSSYKIPGSENHLNGKLVSGEAIADLGGIQLAYHALMKTNPSSKGHVKHFSPAQQFFINFGHIWASKIRDEESIRKGHIDPHPPKIYRVNGTLRNIPEFYEAFNIPNNKKLCTLF